jgi:hypothetical protein
MLGRLAWVTVFMLLAVREVAACSMMSWDPDRLLENEVVSSANGRFRAVVRWYDGIPDFTSRRAGDVFPDGEPGRSRVTVALYESRLLAQIPIDVNRVGEMFVSDSGRYLVALRRLRGSNCGYTESEDPFVTVYRADGALVGSLKVDDVLGSWDLWNVVHGVRYGGVEYGLRPESDTREVFVVKIQISDTQWVERRIDVATAALLDPKTEVFPRPHAYATPVDVPPRDYLPAPADCAAAFDAPDVVRMQSRHFYSRAVFGPVPEYPWIMLRARVRGFVIVDVVVSEYGDVLCTRASGLPFGGTEAASNAARRWRFTPMTIDGHRVKFAGELLFQFQDVDEEKWRDLMRYAPPFEE